MTKNTGYFKPGNTAHTNRGVFRDALERSLARYAAGTVKRGQALNRVADKLVGEGVDGNLQAIQEIASRLDGKPGQSLEIKGGISLIDVLAGFAASRSVNQSVSQNRDGKAADSSQSAPVVQRSSEARSEVSQVKH